MLKISLMLIGLLLAVPQTAKRPVTNSYHGVAVVDDYQWLENFDDAEVRKWNDQQNAFSRAYFDKLPERKIIAEELRKLYSATSPDYSDLQYRRGVLFAMKFQPPAQQPWLVVLKSADDLSSERVVLDPNKLNEKGTTTIDFVVPSLDGRRIAVSMSENGSEDGTLYFCDVESGRQLADKIPRVTFPTGGGSVAWNAEGSGVFYTRYPHAGERPAEDLNFYQQVYFHELGKAVEADRCELSKELPRIAEVELSSDRDGKFVLAKVANGDGGDFAFYLRGAEAGWKQIAKFEDGVKHGEFGGDGAIYFLSLKDAPRGKVLRMPLENAELAGAKVVVNESDGVIQTIAPAQNGIYVEELVGGPSRVRFFSRGGDAPISIALRPVSSVGQMVWLDGDQLLFRQSSYVSPFVWSRVDSPGQEPRASAMIGKSPADFSDVEVVREFATSKDGTKVPMNIIRRKGTKLDGNNPTVLYGYGGYGISMSPHFHLGNRVWLDRGGVYVIANLRGGGEFGEEWHKAGNLTKKQNVFDDFIGCAEWLIKNNYTNPKRLAIEGGSNGGLLMGAVLTQRPDLFRAVVSSVGFYDSLRTELEPNGEFNVTEFGTVKDPEQFRALYAYSPYHRVVDGAKYPAVLLSSGDNDGRVNPFHSRKMAARLQAASSSGYPILLRTTSSAGHGIGTALDERIAEEADAYVFLMDQLGMEYKAAPR